MSAAQLSAALPADMVNIVTDAVTEPFWQAAKERRLVIPRCGDCGTYRMPPTPFCPECQSVSVDWPQMSGRAIVYSFAVVHGYPEGSTSPLVPAVVELPEAPGARLVTNVIDVLPEDVYIGMALTVDFHPVAGGWMLPVFRAAVDTEKD